MARESKKARKATRKQAREEQRTRATISVVLATLHQLERRRSEARADDIAAVDLVVARRTARLCGYPQKFADMMLRSMPFIEVVDRLRSSAARVV
jgi:hypothetical protein